MDVMNMYHKKRNLTNSTRREEEWDAWKEEEEWLHKSKHKVNEKIMTMLRKL
jgi:hypothetical protein